MDSADDGLATLDDGWQPARTSWSPHRADLADLLRQSTMVRSAALPWGSNENFLVMLDGESAGQSYAVYKPQLGEAPLWDFPDGTLYRREYASYLVSTALRWHIVPPTVVRDGPYGVGAVQLFIESERHGPRRIVDDQGIEAIKRISVFDCLVNNTDRKAEHLLIDMGGHIWGIDHGLTFHRQPKLRTVIWDFAGEPIPPHFLADLQTLADLLCGSQPLRAALDGLLTPPEIAALCRRLDGLLSTRVYPYPTSNRSVPWSMW